MSEPDEFYPPVQYAPWWMLLALGIIVLAILAVWLILLFTRPRRATTAAAPVAADALTMLRHEYLDGIGRIEQAWRARELTARQANLELSRTTRQFVNEYSGSRPPC